MSHILEAISCSWDPGVLFVKAFCCFWTVLQDRSQSRGLATLCTRDGRWESHVISGNSREAHSLPHLTSHPGSPAIPSNPQPPIPHAFSISWTFRVPLITFCDLWEGKCCWSVQNIANGSWASGGRAARSYWEDTIHAHHAEMTGAAEWLLLDSRFLVERRNLTLPTPPHSNPTTIPVLPFISKDRSQSI